MGTRLRLYTLGSDSNASPQCPHFLSTRLPGSNGFFGEGPFAPAIEQGKVQPERDGPARDARNQCRVVFKLLAVAPLLIVEKLVALAAAMLADFEIDDPEAILVIAKNTVD